MTEHFKILFNVEEERENEQEIYVLGDLNKLNESLITREEVQEAVREMKQGNLQAWWVCERMFEKWRSNCC